MYILIFIVNKLRMLKTNTYLLTPGKVYLSQTNENKNNFC